MEFDQRLSVFFYLICTHLPGEIDHVMREIELSGRLLGRVAFCQTAWAGGFLSDCLGGWLSVRLLGWAAFCQIAWVGGFLSDCLGGRLSVRLLAANGNPYLTMLWAKSTVSCIIMRGV